MKMFSAACLAVTTALTFAGSSMAQQPAGTAQVQAVTVSHSNCQHCQNGQQHSGQCNNPSCPLSRFQIYPDGGYNPPVNMPVNYNWAQYQQILPAQPYGTAGGGFTAQYPSVANPSDTAQSGYYLHKVPSWQPQPGMIPPTPNPALFHNRVCPAPGQPGVIHHHVQQLHAANSRTDSMEGVVRIPSRRQATSATQAAVPAPRPAERPRPVVTAPRPVPSAGSAATKQAAEKVAAAQPRQSTKAVSTQSAPRTMVRPAVKTTSPAKKPAFRLSSLFD
ncbi:MAG: hypothetical protein ACK5TG_16185 [Planctomyces sp.]|jgi:hypothetical protein